MAEKRTAPVATVVVGILLTLVFVFYPLSLGPAVMLERRGMIESNYLEIIYYPIVLLHEHTPLRAPLEWYVELWD